MQIFKFDISDVLKKIRNQTKFSLKILSVQYSAKNVVVT